MSETPFHAALEEARRQAHTVSVDEPWGHYARESAGRAFRFRAWRARKTYWRPETEERDRIVDSMADFTEKFYERNGTLPLRRKVVEHVREEEGLGSLSLIWLIFSVGSFLLKLRELLRARQ